MPLAFTIPELRAAAAEVHAEIEQLRAEGAAEHRPVEAVRKAP